jgi:hypothetical protein
MTSLAADSLQKFTIFLPEYLKGWQLFRTSKLSTGFRVSRQAMGNAFVFPCFSKLLEIYCLLIEGHVCIWSQIYKQKFFIMDCVGEHSIFFCLMPLCFYNASKVA